MTNTAGTSQRVGWGVDVSGETPFANLTKRKFARDETLVLVDGRGMAYRAYHSKPILQATNGTPTAALFGMLETLSLLLDAANTSRVCLSWDGSVAYKRKVFSGYKSRHDRTRTPEEQAEHDRSQKAIAIARRTIESIGVPSVHVPEIETDDAIGVLANLAASLAGKARDFPKRVLVVADDKDYYQLIRPGVDGVGEVLVWRTGYAEAIDAATMLERTGLRPDQWADFKALVGESATGDHIPGVDGIGEKTATKFIATHGSLEAAIAYAKKAYQTAKPKPMKSEVALAMSAEIARRAYVLSKIAPDVAYLAKTYGLDAASITPKIHSAIKASVAPRTIDVAALRRTLAMYEIGSLPAETLARRLGFSIPDGPR